MYNTRVIFSMIYMYLYKYLCYTGCAGAKMATGHYNERRFKSTSVVCHQRAHFHSLTKPEVDINQKLFLARPVTFFYISYKIRIFRKCSNASFHLHDNDINTFVKLVVLEQKWRPDIILSFGLNPRWRFVTRARIFIRLQNLNLISIKNLFQLDL